MAAFTVPRKQLSLVAIGVLLQALEGVTVFLLEPQDICVTTGSLASIYCKTDVSLPLELRRIRGGADVVLRTFNDNTDTSTPSAISRLHTTEMATGSDRPTVVTTSFMYSSTAGISTAKSYNYVGITLSNVTSDMIGDVYYCKTGGVVSRKAMVNERDLTCSWCNNFNISTSATVTADREKYNPSKACSLELDNELEIALQFPPDSQTPRVVISLEGKGIRFQQWISEWNCTLPSTSIAAKLPVDIAPFLTNPNSNLVSTATLRVEIEHPQLAVQEYVLIDQATVCRKPISIQNIDPLYGPETGGTLVTVRGSTLGQIDSNSLKVLLGSMLCELTSRDGDALVVATPSLRPPFVKESPLPMKVQCWGDLDVKMDKQFEFKYKKDPEIKSVRPMESLAVGGIQITVSGASLDAVAHPAMVATAVWQKSGDEIESNTTKVTYFSECEVVSAKKMMCLSPEINIKLWEIMNDSPQSSTLSSASLVEEKVNLPLFLSFVLDGVDKYSYENFRQTLPDYSILTVYKDPPGIISWDDVLKIKGHDTITIQAAPGEDLKRGWSAADYSVTIGQEICENLDLHANSIQCIAPKKEPRASTQTSNDDSLPVTVHIGYHVEYVGVLKYQSDGWLDNSIVKWSLMAGCPALIVILIVVIVTCLVSKYRKNKNGEQDSSGPNVYSGSRGSHIFLPGRDLQPENQGISRGARKDGPPLFNSFQSTNRTFMGYP